MTEISHADGVLPFEVRIPVHPTGCLCPQSPACQGKAVGPQVPAHHPRRNLPARRWRLCCETSNHLSSRGHKAHLARSAKRRSTMLEPPAVRLR
jgi:hypothetical protein